ncbi:MAG: hypothetical protein EPO37_08275 [Nitrosarchaeum sp.]|nr:MAG: hypothetical protein EPO37_08275 [Nitrosarchaeum sp.]
MKYKNAISMTTLSVIAVFAITSFTGFEISDTDAETVAVQPEKFVFVEKISTTALFEFRDGTEIVPIQQFTQTSGFGIRGDSRQIPTFTMEKIVGLTPYLYEAADQAQKYGPEMEYPYKNFDVTVFLAAEGDTLRSFEYSDCVITSYTVTTRSDNEEGYTGKGFAIVDQFTFECRGYEPHNPIMDEMNIVEKAKTISSGDLKSTDKWGPGFSIKP